MRGPQRLSFGVLLGCCLTGNLLQETAGQTKENLRLELEVGSTGADTSEGNLGTSRPFLHPTPSSFCKRVTDKVTDFVLWDVGGYLAADLGSEVYKQSEDQHIQNRGQGGMQCPLEGGTRPPTE